MMQDSNNDIVPKCPTLLELNAWHDGDREGSVDRHLQNCRRCRKVVLDYARIDEAMRRGVPGHDRAMIDRISRQCRRPRLTPYLLFYHLARAAAVIMIVLGLAGLFLQRSQPDSELIAEQLPDEPVRMDLDSLPGGYLVLLKNGNELKPLYGPWMTDRQQPVPIGGNRGNRLVSLGSETREREPLAVLLPQEIRHVWVVDDLSSSRDQIMESLPEGARCVIQRGNNDNSLELSIWMEEGKLQDLVDTLAADFGWALVSSNLPQPGQGSRLISQRREILYNCSLIVR